MENLLDKYTKTELIERVDSTDIDVEQESETEVNNISNERRKLYVDKVDKSTSDLFRMILDGELILQPDYQRKFVWEKKTMSKFIESLLLAIPIPTIFLAENEDDTFEVIDGQQRITTIFAFMKSQKLNDDQKEKIEKLPAELCDIDNLILSGLETLRQYNGMSFFDMDDAQRKFNNVSLPIVIIKKDSSEDIKYDIFARINSGSIKLNNQELLNVMYRGELLRSLDEVATSTKVDIAFGERPVLKKRFGYHEILLRAISMEGFINSNTWELQEVPVRNTQCLDKRTKKYTGRLNSIVLDYLKEFRNDRDEAARLKTFLEDAISKVMLVFGDEAFKRVSKIKSNSINKTIAELQIVVLSKIDLSEVEKNKDLIRDSFHNFLNQNDESMFTRGTNNTSNVEKRYRWGKILTKELEED